jgi:hypothetical protein
MSDARRSDMDRDDEGRKDFSAGLYFTIGASGLVPLLGGLAKGMWWTATFAPLVLLSFALGWRAARRDGRI